MPFCPRCGKEVTELDVYCPNCGENLKGAVEAAASATPTPPPTPPPTLPPGATGSLSFAVDLATRKPIVFAPTVIGSLISIILTGITAMLFGVSFWQSGSFWNNPMNWTGGAAILGGIVVLSLIGAIVSYILFLASIDMSRDAYLDRPLDIGESVRYVVSRLGTFIVASIIAVVFTVTIVLIPVAILMFVILVVDETGIGSSISRAFSVLGRRLGDVLIVILIAIVGGIILNYIPIIGGLLSACLNVVIGIAFIALYYDYKRNNP